MVLQLTLVIWYLSVATVRRVVYSLTIAQIMRKYAHISKRHFKNSLLLYCIGSLFGKKKLNHRPNDEMSNYLCASEILIVS